MKEIQLNIGVAYVDYEEFLVLSQWKWRKDANGYAYRTAWVNGKRKNIKMHRQIMNAPKGMHVDHKNRNRLCNLRSNLRLCKPRSNQRNKPALGGTSKYKGVYRYVYKLMNGEVVEKWRAKIQVGTKYISLGLHMSEDAAALAYNKAAKRYHRDYALLNVIGGTREDLLP